MTRLFFVALTLRLGAALLSPGTGDSNNFITAARATLRAVSPYEIFGSYNYPPLYSGLLAATLALIDRLGIPDTLAVKFLPILADSLIAPFVCATAARWHPAAARKLGWLYALNPITLLIAAHHGHFDSLATLPVLAAIFWQSAGFSLVLSALALGLGGALKIVPAFAGIAWFAELRGLSRWVAFGGIIAALVLGTLAAGWVSSPRGFTEHVLQHRRVIGGGWGFYFPILLSEQVAKRFACDGWLEMTQVLRGSHRVILIFGLVLTAYLTRARPFAERILLTQLALQVFAGRWAAEYTAWVAPMFVLSNQRGLIAWSVATLAWMLPIYVLFAAPQIYHDNLNRAITLIGAPYWVVCAAWYWSNWRGAHKLRWMTEPLFSK